MPKEFHKLISKNPHEVFYMSMHAVWKELSTTTKVHAVFDASAKTSTGTSLSDILLIGPTVHPLLLTYSFIFVCIA